MEGRRQHLANRRPQLRTQNFGILGTLRREVSRPCGRIRHRDVMERRFPDHSTLMPANFTTLAHFSVSSAMSLPKSAGVVGTGTPPSSLNRAFILGSASP